MVAGWGWGGMSVTDPVFVRCAGSSSQECYPPPCAVLGAGWDLREDHFLRMLLGAVGRFVILG